MLKNLNGLGSRSISTSHKTHSLCSIPVIIIEKFYQMNGRAESVISTSKFFLDTEAASTLYNFAKFLVLELSNFDYQLVCSVDGLRTENERRRRYASDHYEA